MAYTRKAKWQDAFSLAPNLREADLKEIEAASGRTPIDVLYEGCRIGKPCKSIVSGDGERILGMYGVVPVSESVATIWCLATEELVSDLKFTFIKHCRKEIAEIVKGYDLVFNMVYSKNTKHIKWLKVMGFTVVDDTPILWGPKEKEFFYFEKVINNV